MSEYKCNTEGCSADDCDNCRAYRMYRSRALTAESILADFKEAHCLRALLGEDDDGCMCMGCQARAYFRVMPSFFGGAA